MLSSLKSTFKSAPLILLGAFFLCTSCKKIEPTSLEISESKVEPKITTTTTKEKAPSKPQKAEADEPAPETPGIRFLSYNLKNYLTMSRYLKGGKKEDRSKPEEEIDVLIKIIVSEKPDILGVCEIGTIDDLRDLQSRLKKAGLDLPHLEHAGGKDPTRRLGILSDFPIIARNSQETLPYTLDGNEMFMSRGILDATIELPRGPTHFIGVHLKSKREVPDADQALMRLNEAQLLKKHCNAIIAKNADARIIVYGDMNETKGEAPIKSIRGQRSTKSYLDDVWAKDSRAEFWTHYWKYQDQYARFDYVFFSQAMKPEMDFKGCYIVDPVDFYDASDHRAIMVKIVR